MTDLPSQVASPIKSSSSPSSSKLLLLLVGLIAGIVLTLTLCGLVALVYFGPHGSLSRQPADHARVAELAQLLAGRLETTVQGDVSASESELRARIATTLQRVESLADARDEIAPIAAEYATCLRGLLEMADKQPSLQPLIREGIDAWRGSLDDDNHKVMLGLLGMGVEFSKQTEFVAQVRGLHARIIACRLRLVEVASRVAAQGVNRGFELRFQESGYFGPPDDHILVTNTSGIRLTDVLLVTELRGRSGETFSNSYFAKRWEPGQQLIATCQSDKPVRETVQGVQLVRARVFAAEGSTGIAELSK